MSIPKFKYKLQTCKIKSSKLSSLAMLNTDVQKRIFTNFKTVGHEFSIYATRPHRGGLYKTLHKTKLQV